MRWPAVRVGDDDRHQQRHADPAVQHWSPGCPRPTTCSVPGKTSLRAIGSYFYSTKITSRISSAAVYTDPLRWGPNASSGACSAARAMLDRCEPRRYHPDQPPPRPPRDRRPRRHQATASSWRPCAVRQHRRIRSAKIGRTREAIVGMQHDWYRIWRSAWTSSTQVNDLRPRDYTIASSLAPDMSACERSMCPRRTPIRSPSLTATYYQIPSGSRRRVSATSP